ncbi:MAG: response regulator transcription factor [Caldimonas sp.]
MPHRVLIVEDDYEIASNLFAYLAPREFDVDVVYSGSAALHRCSTEAFDVILLDLGLPGVDGLVLLERLRVDLRLGVPVLVISARSDLSDKLAAFERGADDYMTKPFALAEVEARIKALLNRAAGVVVPQPVMRFGSLEYDARQGQARVGGVAVHLTRKAARLLELLMQHPGQLVRRQQIERALWPEGPPQPDVLRSHVHGLRKALGDAGFEGLATVHGVGYRLENDRETA